MKYFLSSLAVLSMVAFSGCDKGASGGPGVNLPASEQATFGLTENTFSLDTPMMSTAVIQGQSAEVTIGISRGTNIDQDVTIRFDELPAGMSVTPASPVIKHGDEEAKVTVSAVPDAALGDFVIKVIGQPASGPSATGEIKISVAKP